MWQLVKAEIEYNIYFITVLFVFILGYAILAMTDTRLISNTDFDEGFLGLIFTFVFYFLFYAIWAIRIKEKRIRVHTLLPVPITKIAMSRLVFVQILIMSILVCIILIMSVTYPSWDEDADNILFQLGGVLIVFSIAVICRDVWFIPRDNPIIRFITVSVFLASMIIPTIFIFMVIRPVFYELLGRVAGKSLYLLWGSVLLFGTTKAFVNRKYFLS